MLLMSATLILTSAKINFITYNLKCVRVCVIVYYVQLTPHRFGFIKLILKLIFFFEFASWCFGEAVSYFVI